MPHDVANTERFRAVIDLCDQIDEFVMNYEGADETDEAIVTPSQQVLSAIGTVVGTVLHSIWDRKHHSVTIDARFGIEGHDAAPVSVKVHAASRPIQLECGPDMQPTSDHPVWQCLNKLHEFVSDLYEATNDIDARRLLDSLLLTIGGIDVAVREDKVTNTLVCAEAKEGLVNVTAVPTRME